MASYKTAFGSYLKTEDLQNREIVVVIEAVGLEQIKGDHGMEQKLVAHFIGKDKGLILNMTNCELLEQITGTDDYDDWPGTRVVLYPTTTKFGGKTVPCLRIKQAAQSAKRRPAPPPEPEPEPEEFEPIHEPITDDDIPF